MDNASRPVIRVTDFKAAYGDAVILEHVSFEVAPGEVFVILGGSGCGKSTLLKHMIGLYEPAGGSIEVDGRDVAGPEREQVLRSIGVSYQSGALFGSMTLLENVRLPLEEFTSLPPAAVDVVARLKLSLVGLSGYEEHLPSEISGGMVKRGAIARAMALDPSILFLDEPSAGLDPVTSAGLDHLILELREALGITFVIVTHELASIYTIADRVIMLDRSTRSIIAEGAPRELRDHSDNALVRRFFNRECESEQCHGT